MKKDRVAGFGVSLDGFSAGIEQSLKDPLGVRGGEIFEWFFHTRTFCSMHGEDRGTVGDVDDQFAQRAMDNLGEMRGQHTYPRNCCNRYAVPLSPLYLLDPM